MPTSALALAHHLVNLAEQTRADSILDVGPGYGKYGVLLREYLNHKPSELSCVEAERRYLDGARAILHVEAYDEVYLGDVRDPTWTPFVALASGLAVTVPNRIAEFDLVWMVDVLEHLPKADGAALLEAIPGWMVVCTPSHFFQNPEALQGWETERHRSVWSLDDLRRVRDVHPATHRVRGPETVGAVIALIEPQEAR
jgi:hypothetical protein